MGGQFSSERLPNLNFNCACCSSTLDTLDGEELGCEVEDGELDAGSGPQHVREDNISKQTD